MQPHQQRVVIEREELETKMAALNTFMHGDVYASLNAIDQGLLMVQMVAMQNYSDVLFRRIELF